MSSSSPFFSVIIPTYNRAKSIVEAVESVLSQTYSDFELLVIDDGSTDNTQELLAPIAERDQRLRYIFQENAERSAARNHGIDLAKGEYICFLDSDDVFLPIHLEEFYQVIDRENKPIALFCCNAIVEVNGHQQKEPPYVTETEDPVELMFKISIPSQQMAIHNSILAIHKYDIGIRIGEDQELWSRIVKEFPVIKCDHYSVVIRDLGDRTISIANSTTYHANLNVRKKIIAADKDGRIKPKWRKFALSAAYYKLAISYLSGKQRALFYKYIIISIVTDPSHFFIDKLASMIGIWPMFRPLVEKRLPSFVKSVL